MKKLQNTNNPFSHCDPNKLKEMIELVMTDGLWETQEKRLQREKKKIQRKIEDF